jgi:hypothetical protein
LTTLNVAAKIRWGHQDPFTVTLTEPNAGQHQGPLPVVGENFTITLTGPPTHTILATSWSMPRVMSRCQSASTELVHPQLIPTVGSG